jgi:hypothetical protein
MAAVDAFLSSAGLLKCTKSTATERATPTSKRTATERATSFTNHRLVKPNTKLLKKSTATERAMSSTDHFSWTVIPKSTSKRQESTASVDGWDSGYMAIGDSDLEKIVALLLWMAQDFQSHIHIDEIHHAALELICNTYGGTVGELNAISLTKLSELIDIMMLNKDGSSKDADATLSLMRRLAAIRDEVLGQRSIDNATEHVELHPEEVSLCYRLFGRALITYDLLPHQKRDDRYLLRNNCPDDTHLSTFQRSFTDSMLRRYLGNKKVATVVWQHGLPSIADMPLVYHRRADTKRQHMGMLQSGLEECLHWYSSLANDIVVHQSQESFEAQVSASSLDKQERQRQQARREALQKARHDARLGAILAKQRDDRKRSYDDMNEAEQKTLEDYETGRIKRAKLRLTTPRVKPFRSKLQRGPIKLSKQL